MLGLEHEMVKVMLLSIFITLQVRVAYT